MTPPEVLLKAARKAYPEFEWRGGPIPWRYIGDIRDDEHELYLKATYGVQTRWFFNIQQDWPALQIALEAQENGGWTFWRTYDGTFVAESWDESKILHAPTKPDLLLAIVRESA